MKEHSAINGGPKSQSRPEAREGSGSAELHVAFLDPAESAGMKAWLDLWESWPGREVTAHPDFVSLFARPGDQVVCATARTATGGVLYPVIVRPIASEPWASRDIRGCDLTTAYGYGGPFAWNVGEDEARSFWRRFDSWATGLRAVTSFARLSLFPEQLLPLQGEVQDRGPNVVRSLNLSDDELWSDYESKVRKNVKRARQEGVVIRFDPQGLRLDDFVSVYESTMKRRDALSQYFFPRSFFESIISDLPGQFVFVHAIAGDKVVSSELVLLSEEHAYFYLGGTLAEAYHLRPNDLLQHEMFRYCRDAGLKWCVLGGGYRPDDGVLRFKRSFAPGGELPFRVGVKVYDAEECSRLVERRRAWERAEGREWTPAPDFFPTYRS
ncbi:MAG TPA: GNAT family N-acetyltransferase [Planctomycetota bacterium]|nr:GNAT family N-acetyltransferase [Planctomycetota bacterium]